MKYTTGKDGTKILYLHQSDLNDLRMCPEQARLKAIGEYFDPDSDVAHIGTRVHSWIQQCLEYFKSVREWPTPNVIEVWLNREIIELHENWPTLWTKEHMVENVDQAIEYLQDCCSLWWNEVLPQIDTRRPDLWQIEQRFDVPVWGYEGTEIRLRGSKDFWDATVIWDWKTGKPTAQWQLEREDIQSTVYTYAHHVDTLDHQVPFNFAYVSRGAKEAIIRPLVRCESDWRFMLEEVESWGKTILRLGFDGRWPLGPSGWWCSTRWCSEFAQGKCRGKHHQGFWPDEPNNLVELRRKVDAGLIPAPAEHHPDREE